ncbi:MAG: hypothetical protein QM820_14065 [Minicystis sp.]
MDAHLDRFHDQVRRLCGIALGRLPSMIDPATGLVVFRVDGEELAPSGTSVRYTAMTALGVERAAEHGLPCDVDIEQLYEALDATLAGVDNSGDLGLILWASAHVAPQIAERALRDLGEFGDIARTRKGQMVHTTELAWVVTGLSEALSAGIGDERDVRTRLDRAFRRLLDHRGSSGLMCFARPLSRGITLDPRVLIQGRLGFFDAQVYTIVACLRRDAVTPDPAAREAARAIADRILHHQHPLGQWGWRYNVESGGLVDLYPVYSVHQDGMAPMALLPLERALGVPTTAAVARGVSWLFGENEIGERLAVESEQRIWRSVRRRGHRRHVLYPLEAASLLHLGDSLDLGARFAGALEIDRELRPYHLGWCLYAFSELAAAYRERADGVDCEEPRPTLRTGAVSAPSRRARASNSA